MEDKISKERVVLVADWNIRDVALCSVCCARDVVLCSVLGKSRRCYHWVGGLHKVIGIWGVGLS